MFHHQQLKSYYPRPRPALKGEPFINPEPAFTLLKVHKNIPSNPQNLSCTIQLIKCFPHL